MAKRRKSRRNSPGKIRVTKKIETYDWDEFTKWWPEISKKLINHVHIDRVDLVAHPPGKSKNVRVRFRFKGPYFQEKFKGGR
jgi:hypothetical protein